MELESIEFVLKLVYFQTVRIHVFSVAIPRVVDLIDDHQGVTVDQESFDAKRNYQTEPV